MYCRKCGTELPDNAKKCVQCGTETVHKDNLKKNHSKGNMFMFILLVVACFFIFFFLPTIGVDVHEHGKIHVSIGQLAGSDIAEESDFIAMAPFNIVLHMIAVVFLIPAIILRILRKPVRSLYMYPVRVVLIWTEIYYIISYFIVRDDNIPRDWGATVEIYPTFWGLLLIVMGLAALIYSFKIARKIKKNQKNEK